ncbi:MAG: DUF3794 domain-containing protein [Clostridia bacterium]|nr:DUF3794 domain-containing protein [Clostridia bacterium]
MDNKFSNPEARPVRVERIPTVTLTHEAGGEHVLPDYLPPIRRMVALRASVLPEGKFLSSGGASGSLEVAGTVAYTLIYTDDEGKLTGASLTSDYSATTALPAGIEDAAVQTTAENNSCRVLAPRKVSLRSRLQTEVEAMRAVPLEERVNGRLTPADAIHMERLPVEISSVRCFRGEGRGLRVEGLLAESAEALRPIVCDGNVTVKSARATADGVTVRGTVTVSCLCVPEDSLTPEMPTRMEKTEEFEEHVEISGCAEGDLVTATGRSVSLLIHNDETADGLREISYELLFDVEATATRNERAEATADLYSTEREMACTYQTGECLSAERAILASLSLSESLPYKGAPGTRCVDVSARAIPERKEWKDGKLVLSGTVVFGVVLCGEGMEFTGEDYRVPFRYTCDSAAKNGCVHVSCSCSAESARLDAGKIILGAEVFLSGTIFDRASVTTVETVTPGEAYPSEESATFRVFYPSGEESLWQVGKRYRKSCRSLAEENGLTGELSAALGGVGKLIV